ASLRRSDGTYGPAVVARVDDVEGRLIAIHRTWIGLDDNGIWRRLDRKALGPIRGGAACTSRWDADGRRGRRDFFGSHAGRRNTSLGGVKYLGSGLAGAAVDRT